MTIFSFILCGILLCESTTSYQITLFPCLSPSDKCHIFLSRKKYILIYIYLYEYIFNTTIFIPFFSPLHFHFNIETQAVNFPSNFFSLFPLPVMFFILPGHMWTFVFCPLFLLNQGVSPLVSLPTHLIFLLLLFKL